MDLKKSVARKGNYGLRGSRLFGMIRKVISTNQMGNTKVGFQASLNHEARKHALDSVLEAERWKAQAITLTRQIAYV